MPPQQVLAHRPRPTETSDPDIQIVPSKALRTAVFRYPDDSGNKDVPNIPGIDVSPEHICDLVIGSVLVAENQRGKDADPSYKAIKDEEVRVFIFLTEDLDPSSTEEAYTAAIIRDKARIGGGSSSTEPTYYVVYSGYGATTVKEAFDKLLRDAGVYQAAYTIPDLMIH